MYRLVIAVLFAFAMSSVTPGAADAANGWVLVKSSGDVRVQTAPGQWTPISTTSSLQPGDTVWTGPRGRALLQHAEGVLTLAPGSMVRIPDHDFGPKRTIMLHYQGQVAADVEKRRSGQFAIRTPYLAAVVKGTKFSVAIGAEMTVVAVQEGVVVVQDMDTGQATRLRAGRAVATRHLPGMGLSGQFDATGLTPDSLLQAVETQNAALSGGGSGSEGVGGAVGGVSSTLDSTVSSVGDAAGSTVSSVGNAVGSTVSSVGNAVGGAASSAGGAVGGSLGGTVSSVGETAGGAISSVGGLVSGL